MGLPNMFSEVGSTVAKKPGTRCTAPSIPEIVLRGVASLVETRIATVLTGPEGLNPHPNDVFDSFADPSQAPYALPPATWQVKLVGPVFGNQFNCHRPARCELMGQP